MKKIHASNLDGRSYCFVCAHSDFVEGGYMVCLNENPQFGNVEKPNECEDYEP